jgi:hypothetical protein
LALVASVYQQCSKGFCTADINPATTQPVQFLKLRRLNFLQINISETKLELFGINLPVE